MSSEWMKVMLDEIARKKSEAIEAQAELDRRRLDQETSPSSDTLAPRATAFGNTPRGELPAGRPPQ
jgi:hypothetical protein